jgi:hypothetical protein
MGAPTIYRQVMQAACATCGAEWFGPGAEKVARRHGSDTGHQVELQILHRETINPVREGGDADYAPQVALTANETRKSIEAARERVSLFEQPIGRQAPVQRHGARP